MRSNIFVLGLWTWSLVQPWNRDAPVDNWVQYWIGNAIQGGTWLWKLNSWVITCIIIRCKDLGPFFSHPKGDVIAPENPHLHWKVTFTAIEKIQNPLFPRTTSFMHVHYTRLNLTEVHSSDNVVTCRGAQPLIMPLYESNALDAITDPPPWLLRQKVIIHNPQNKWVNWPDCTKLPSAMPIGIACLWGCVCLRVFLTIAKYPHRLSLLDSTDLAHSTVLLLFKTPNT